MRVLWLQHFLPYPPTGGSLLRSYHLIAEVARSAEIDLLSFVQRSLSPRQHDIDAGVGHLQTICRTVETFEIPFGDKWKKLALAGRCCVTGECYTTTWTYSVEYKTAAANAMGRGYDVLWVDTIGLAGNVPLPTTATIVLDHHNEEVSMLERRASNVRSPLERWFVDAEARKLREESQEFFPRVRLHLVASQVDARRLAGIDHLARSIVVPNGVDTREYDAVYGTGRTDHFDLLFVGGATYPNLDAVHWFLSEMWPTVRHEIPNSRLVLVGRAPSRKMVSWSKRDSRVIVTGYVEDIRPWAAQAAAFICPMRLGGGTRLKLLHAFSMGLPVVSTEMGMEGIDALAGREYLRADSPVEFIDCLTRLNESSELGKNLSVGGRRLVVEHYDWKSIGMRLRESLSDTAEQ